jgi:F-type H+-transporting ATPase subunit b
MDALLYPAFGTVFWASIAFLAVLFILRKTAWGPILKALSEREESIANSLREAEKAREEMAELNSDNERLLQEARAKRDEMLKESKDIAAKLVSDAKADARAIATKEIESARQAIETERKAAIAELKAEVAKLSVDIAERLIKEELADSDKQKNLIDKLISESTIS